jgi:DNA-binding beta-propeller fold protein YncE
MTRLIACSVLLVVSLASGQVLERIIGLPDSLGVNQFGPHMTLDSAHNKVYAASTGALSVLGGPEGRRIGRIAASVAGLTGQSGCYLYPQAGRLYWVRGYDTVITVISTTNDSVIGQLKTRPTEKFGDGDYMACIDTAGHRLYARTNGGMAAFDISADTFIHFIGSGAATCFNPRNRRLYILDGNDVQIIDPGPDTLLKVIPAQQVASRISYLHRCNKVYVTNRYSKSVTIIDGAGDSLLEHLYLGAAPYTFEMNEEDGKVYAAGEVQTAVIDGWGDSVRTLLPDTRTLSWNPRVDKVYICHDNKVIVVDGKSDSILKEIRCPLDIPFSAGCNPAAGLVYFASAHSELAAIDCLADTLLWREIAGGVLNGRAWSPLHRRLFGLTSRSLVSISPDAGIPPLFKEWAEGLQIELAPDESKLYLTRGNADSSARWLYVASCTTLEVTDSIALSGWPGVFYPVPGVPRIYCTIETPTQRTNAPERTLAIVDTENDSVVRELVADEFLSFALSDISRKVYVMGRRGLSTGLAVFDVDGDSLLKRIQVAENAWSYEMCWHPPSNRLYVSTDMSPELKMVDCLADSVVGGIDSVPMSGSINYNPIWNKMYCLIVSHPLAFLTVVDCSTNRFVREIQTEADGGQPAYNRRGDKLYLAADPSTNTVPGRVVVVDCATDLVGPQFAVGGGIHGFAVDEDSGIIFTSCSDSRLYLLRDTVPTGVHEQLGAKLGRQVAPSLVSRMLTLGANRSASLHDITGRKVLDLHPGANDVRALAPGVYFVRSEPSAVSGKPSAVAVRKVVLTR